MTGVAEGTGFTGAVITSSGSATPPPRIYGPFVTEPEDVLPAPVNPVPSATPVIYGVWSHPAVPAGEHITIQLLAVNVGAAAAPMSQVSAAELDATIAAPMHGPLNFSLPRPWPPGQYRVVATGSTLGEFATLDFVVQ